MVRKEKQLVRGKVKFMCFCSPYGNMMTVRISNYMRRSTGMCIIHQYVAADILKKIKVLKALLMCRIKKNNQG